MPDLSLLRMSTLKSDRVGFADSRIFPMSETYTERVSHVSHNIS